MRRLIAGLTLLVTATGASRALRAQDAPTATRHNLLVRVQAVVEQVPLGYSVVSLPALGVSRFTSANGAIVVPVPAPGPQRLVVKRLGFAPKDTVITIGDAPSQLITIELVRVSFRLDAVRVVAWPPCRRPGLRDATAEMRGIVEQIRQNAERYRLLTKLYPFDYLMERETGHREDDGSYVAESRETVAVSANPGWTYRPGDLVVREAGRPDWMMRIPSISDLAEDSFVDNHCFHVAGLESKSDARLLRIDIVASQRLRRTDVNVSVWLDPTDYQLRFATFTLTKPPPQVPFLVGSTSSASYRELIPFVPVLHVLTAESNYRIGRTRADANSYVRVVVEQQTNQRVTYLGARPDALARDSLPRPQPDR